MLDLFNQIYMQYNNLIKDTFLSSTFWGNSIGDYLLYVFIAFVVLLFIKLLRNLSIKALSRIFEGSDHYILNFIIKNIKKNIKPLEYFTVYYYLLNILNLSKKTQHTADIIALIIVTFFVMRFLLSLLEFIIRYKLEGEENASKVHIVRSIIPAVKILGWGMCVVFILSNLGFDISALVAGLGVGGVAVALAAQAVLGDLFSYVAIVVDKPFEIGDFITVGEFSGSVSRLGIKTTRITSLSGEELIFSNSDLTGSRVKNYKRMTDRRIVFNIGVTYDTPIEKLKQIPQVITQVVAETEKTTLERCHFFSHGDFALIFQTVYYVHSPEYIDYMNAQQTINFMLHERLAAMGVEFAFPTQSIQLTNKQIRIDLSDKKS